MAGLNLGENLFEKYGKTYQPGEIIFCEYEPGDDFFLILTGQVKISKIVSNKEKTLDFMGPGDVFGEMSILEQQPRSATVIAQDEVRVLVFNRENFEMVLKSDPQMALKLLKIFCKRIFDAQRQLMILILDGDEYRVADVFVMMAERQGVPLDQRIKVDIKLSIEEIANMCAITPENCQKALNQYVRVGKIELVPGKVVVNNISEFVRIVHNKRKIKQGR
ncbi:MAG: Crp/Fnr family transcriptional regulator [Spirochaetes bacterium]|nr:Crp/Fnr family transcriptional regulator [Spirochaetota bacterium]